MKINRSALRRLIEAEIENIGEDALRHTHDDMHRQNFSASKRKRSCSECGSSMYEGESSCSECGAMYEEKKDMLSEGDCGCGTCAGCADNSKDYSLDTMGIVSDVLGGMMGVADHHHHDHKHRHHNNYMAKPSLYKVAKYAAKLLEMIPDGYELDDWQRTKIAQIADDISEVYHSLDYDVYLGDI